MRRARVAPTLAERVSTPEFKAEVERHRAKLDAEEAGWAVMEPKRARALLAVARTARSVLPTRDHPSNCRCWFCHEDRENLTRALARLDSVSRRGGRR